MGLTKEQRAAQMQDANDGAEPIDLPVASPAPKAVTPAPAPTDMAALVQMLAQALQSSGQQNADTIRDAMTSASAAARNPMHETYLSGGYPGKSVYAHPDGDLAHPRTALRCPMFMGVYNEKGESVPAFEIFGDACTEAERVAYNALVPGVYDVERNDGVTAKWRVVQETDDLGQPIRMVVAAPMTWLKRDAQAQMPTQKSFLRQLTAAAVAA